MLIALGLILLEKVLDMFEIFFCCHTLYTLLFTLYTILIAIPQHLLIKCLVV